MKKNYKGFNLPWLLITIVITSIISGLTTGVIVYNHKTETETIYADLTTDDELKQFLQVYNNITTEYYEDVNKKEMLEKAIATMVNYIGDDYTTYMDNQTTESLVTSLSGEYVGIGIAINNENAIIKVYDGTPAEKAGIKEGDVITGINDTDITQMTSTETVSLIKEQKDYYILKVLREEEELTFKIKNENIIYPNITYNIIEDTTIGYIYISTFSYTLDTQIQKALTELEKEGMTSLIIDVRGNSGGYLESASKVANIFLEKGQKIYSLEYKNDITDFYDDTTSHKDYNVVVLINGSSASASEILAAALKESYGATLVGQTTFGKGKVQQTMNLEDGSMIKYTSAYWLTPSGKCLDETGLEPDYQITNELVTDDEENIVEIIDSQLNKAIELLK